MKKNALIIALLSSCLVLTGCGKNKKNKKEETPAQTEETQTTEDTTEPEKPTTVDINPPSHGV